jgi:hypothetical protein
VNAKRKPQPSVWEELDEFPHIFAPIVLLILTYGAAAVLHVAEVAPLHVAAVGAVVTLFSPLVALFKRFSVLVMISLTGWLTWVAAVSPWGREPALAAVTATIVFGVAHHALVKREARKPDTSAHEEAEKDAKLGRYVKNIERALGKQPGSSGLEEVSRTPFGYANTIAGTTVVLKLPRNGSITYKRLRSISDELEVAFDSPPGLAPTFETGRTGSEVRMHVFERDVLADKIPYEFDRTKVPSIHEPIPLGRYATGEVCVVTFREVAALMVGLKGKGKSALINTHLAHLTGCPDAVVWMMDGKGGRTARPWIKPFLDATTGRPCVDWVAIADPVSAGGMDEADAMLQAVNIAIRHRSKGDGERVVPSKVKPSIILIVEEASVITGVGFGNSNRTKLAQTAVVQGRSEACDALFASQRATVTMIGNGDMKSNLDLRYGLGVTEPADARSIFPNGAMADSLYRLGDDLAYRGVFLMQAPGSTRVMPAKGFYIDPETIPGIAQHNAETAGQLDDETAQAVHEGLVSLGVPGGYHGRWDRLRETLGVSRPASQTVSQPSRPSQSSSQPGQHGVDVARQAIEKARRERAEKAERDAFEQLIAANFETVEVETFDAERDEGETTETRLKAVAPVPSTAPPILRLAMQVMLARGVSEIPSKVLIEDLGDLAAGMSEKSLARLMGTCNVSPIENIIWDGRRKRGYTRDAIETAIKGQTWSQEAFDWPL